MSKLLLKYRFTFPDSSERAFTLEMDRDTAELAPSTRTDLPAWTELAFNQCAGCPLTATAGMKCPAAVHLSTFISGFEDLVSYDTVRVTVESEERSVTATLSAQQALASLLGLVMASSGCPKTAVFRPMARFHLPFSSESETAYRVAAMYLVAQHFAERDGAAADLKLEHLERVYRGVHAVNRGMAQACAPPPARMRSSTRSFCSTSTAASSPPPSTTSLGEIRPAFEALLQGE
jgi:hypothetical protein